MGTPSTPVVGGYASVRWSAIIAGWVVATGVATLMYVAGLAFGFSVFDPYNAVPSAKGVGIGTAIWIVLTWIVSSFLGGMFASWFDGNADQTVGTLHGVGVWGLAIAASAVFVTLGATHALQGGAAVAQAGAAVGTAQRGAVVRAPATPEEDVLTTLQSQVMLGVAQTKAHGTTTASGSASGGQPATGAPGTQPAPATAPPTAPASQAGAADIRRAGEQLDAQAMALVARALYRGNTEGAKALLATNTSLSQAEIDQLVRDMTAQVEKARSDVKAATDAAARYTAMAMWVVFFSILLALVAAAAGGWLGAGHIHRVYHLRYETVTTPPL